MKVSVKVPATTANLGPGFDCLGLALPIYNTVTVEETIMPGTGIEINIIDETHEQDLISIPTDENNIVYKAIELLYNSIGQTPSELKITIRTHIPIARGLGSCCGNCGRADCGKRAFGQAGGRSSFTFHSNRNRKPS